MQITERIVYEIDGEIFRSLELAEKYESDCVGEFMLEHLLDGIVYAPRDRIKLHDNIMKHRDELVALLERH